VRLFRLAFGYFLSPWGLGLLGVLDGTLFVFLPFAVDAAVVYLAARDAPRWWLYAIVACVGSAAGAFVTFELGRRIGAPGLHTLLGKRRVDRLKRRLAHGGAVALAVPALIPPPFPFTAFVLVSGALDVNRPRFFGALS
jgi:membrane protein YqaA with SNARE-associated domain